MDIATTIKTIKAKLPAQVTLVAVSKQQDPAAIQAALTTGQRIFGENKVQEAHRHWANIKFDYADLQLHLIGHLQTNKVREAVALFDVIETLDSPRLADALAHEMKAQRRVLPCFIQVNTGNEPQKSGVEIANVPMLLAHARKAGLTVTGLMCIPPTEEDPLTHFKILADLAKTLDLPHLSMGMSADYEAAIAAGATHVRIGSLLFGERHAT